MLFPPRKNSSASRTICPGKIDLRISHRHRFVFIAVPRTASTSIRRALDPYSDLKSGFERPFYHHATATELRAAFADRDWDWNTYLSFGLVRNPWERMVSQYRYLKQRRGLFHRDRWQVRMADMTHFPSWCRASHDLHLSGTYRQIRQQLEDPNRVLDRKQWRKLGQALHLERLWWPQVRWLMDPKGDPCVSRVCRYEQLTEDMSQVFEQIGIGVDLGNYNRLRPTDYRRYYDAPAVEWIAERFQDDIERFGYRF